MDQHFSCVQVTAAAMLLCLYFIRPLLSSVSDDNGDDHLEFLGRWQENADMTTLTCDKNDSSRVSF